MVKQLETRCKNARVYFRILPEEKICWEHVKILDDSKTIFVRCLQDFLPGGGGGKPNFWRFETDGLFYNSTQGEIYGLIVPGVLESVVDGHNAILLCYGQTGTGKSLTMSGIENSYEDRGFIPRIVADLFNIKEQLRSKLKMCLQMSYVEATKTHLFDLFKCDDNLIDIHSIKNISTIRMENEEQCLKAIFKAEGSKTFVQGSSYNSHSASGVFTITVTSKSLNQTVPTKMISKIHLVDLAGVDTVGNLSCFYKNDFDVGTANLAKTQLEQFLLILIENIPKRISVNQRLNILIQYLRDSLNARSLLRFVGHVRTNKRDLMMTLSMLRFGQIVRGLKSRKLQVESSENEELKVERLENEINQIKRDVALNSMILNSDLRTNVSQDRLSHVKHVAEEYLHNKVDELVLTNVCDINILLKVFKDIYNTLKIEKDSLKDSAYKRAFDDSSISKSSYVTKDNLSAKSSKRLLKSKTSVSMSKQSRSSKKSLPKQGAIAENKKSPRSVSKIVSKGSEGSLKRSKTSSSKVLRSLGRRKSSITTSDTLQDKPLDEAIALQMPIELPTHDEAWKLFTADTANQYEAMTEELRSHEDQAKDLNFVYVQEIKVLQDILAFMDIKRGELLAAKIRRETMRKQRYDEDGNVVLSSLEIDCQRGINEIKNAVVEQQEKVLVLQAELRLHVQLYQGVNKAIDEKFEEFCSSNYKTLIPRLDVHKSTSELILVPGTTPNETSEQINMADDKYSDQENKLMKYESLKKVMNKQKKKLLTSKHVVCSKLEKEHEAAFTLSRNLDDSDP